MTLRAHLTASRTELLVVGVVIFGLFMPALAVPYAFSDDYPVLSTAVGFGRTPYFGSSIVDTAAASGRPFAGLLDELAFSAAGTIDNLRFVRLVGVVGILALALLLHWALVRAGVGRVAATLIALLVCGLPAFQVYGSWAVLFNAPYAALLGGGSSLLATSAAEVSADLKLDRAVGAGALLLVALLIYQPAAMFFWVFCTVALLGAAHDRGRALRIGRMHAAVAVIGVALAFVLAKLAISRVGDDVPNPARNELVRDVGGKLHWFFGDPLRRALNLFDLTPSTPLAILVAAVAVVGLALLLRHRGAPVLPSLAVAAALLLLSYLPNLVVEENSATYRTLPALSALTALFAALGALGLWLTVRGVLLPRVDARVAVVADYVAVGAAAAFVAFCTVTASKNVVSLFVEPQATELRLIRSQVAAFPGLPPRVAVVHLARWQGMTDLVIGDEFGRPSSSKAWTLDTSVFLVLREQGRVTPTGPRPLIEVVPWFDPRFPPGVPRVDARALERLR